MQREEFEQAQVLKQEIIKLTTQRTALERENLRASPLRQNLGKQLGFGAAGKLEWVYFKLAYQQEELTRLSPTQERLNGGTPLSEQVAMPQSETTRQKMERMVTENPLDLEPHIRRVYEALIAAGQPA